MADTYGVTPAAVAGELHALFPGGFTVDTKPTLVQVTSFITTADTVVGLRVVDATGSTPAGSDKAAVLAVRYIIEWVKARVMALVFTGNDPVSVKAAVDPYDTMAGSMLTAIDAMGAQMIGTGLPDPRVLAGGIVPDRDLVITDCDLDQSPNRRRRF